MNEDLFISRQIAKYATSKKLIEFNDKLKLPPVKFYAHVQALGEKDEEGKNVSSLIGITMLDYSDGTGDKAVSVEANISPDELMYVFYKLRQGVENFEFLQGKIFGEPNEKGKSRVSKLMIRRVPKDQKGTVRKYPWYLQIENGTGIKEKRADNGGIYIKPNSYELKAKVFVNINDTDMFRLLNRVSSFINVWELTYAPKLIRSARDIMTKNNSKER